MVAKSREEGAAETAYTAEKLPVGQVVKKQSQL
jgi:hypothetical protein